VASGKRSDRDRIKARLAQKSSGILVPVVYVGSLKTMEPDVQGVVYKFTRGVPLPVPMHVGNILANRGNFKHLADVDHRIYQDPKRWVSSILVARTLHSIGDMLMASMTPKALRKKYPKAKIVMAVPRMSFPLWYHNPWIDELMAWEEVRVGMSRRFDMYFDITRPCVRYESANHPSKKQRIDIYMEHCGVSLPPDEKQPFYMVTQQEREWAHEVTGGRYFFGLQMRANAPIRNWMAGQHCPQDRNKEIVKRWLALNNGVDVMLFDQHRELVDQYDDPRIFKRPGSSIREVFALQERCVQMLTLDSGLLHACGALTIPVVALFGNIHPLARTTYYENVTALFKPESCPHGRAPCNGDCGHQYCLEGITVDEAWEAMSKMWRSAGENRLQLMKGNEAMNRDPVMSNTKENK
jgi:ADP-heptose:LPS heptosyltransferase